MTQHIRLLIGRGNALDSRMPRWTTGQKSRRTLMAGTSGMLVENSSRLSRRVERPCGGIGKERTLVEEAWGADRPGAFIAEGRMWEDSL